LIDGLIVLRQSWCMNAELLTKYYAAWSKPAPDEILACFTDDAVFEDLAFEAKFVGKEQIRSFIDLTYAGVPDFNVVPQKIVSEGDHAMATWIMSGTHSGDFPNLPATGKRFEVRAVSVVTFRDGLISEIVDYWNPGAFV